MAEAIATELPDGLPPNVRNRAMLALSLAAFLAVLETFIANNALPAISWQLGSTPSDTIWVANAYQVAMAVSLLPFSSLGDIGGYRRVYLFGLVVFTWLRWPAGWRDHCRCSSWHVSLRGSGPPVSSA